MRSPRRYSDWRPVALRRVPARWIGTAIGSLAFALVGALWEINYPTITGATALGAFVANRIAARRLRDLRDEGEDRQFAAVLRLSRFSEYGHDEGLVSFEDGYLVFMGRRCAFSLGAKDVLVTGIAANELGFRFKGPGGLRSAQLQIRRSSGFEAAARAWKQVHKRSRDSVLPPALPDPALPLAAILLANALPSLSIVAALLLWRQEKPSHLHLWAALVTLGATILALAQGADLRRLARGERPLLRRQRRRRHPALASGTHLTPPVVRPVDTPSEVRIDA